MQAGADLTEANLIADLTGANLENAKLKGATWIDGSIK
ncbi:pentapeptide repeat-containing protein [Microcoleus sp. herbarium14]